MIFGVRSSPEVSVIALQQTCGARRSYPCLERTLRFEAAPSDVLIRKQRRSVAAVPGMGRVGELNAAQHTHHSPT